MTYRSDTLAFKKTEILKVMQSIDSSFDLGIVQKADESDLTESFNYENETNFNDYRKFLFKMPLLSLWEAASIISGINPASLDELNEYDARVKYPDLSSALNFLNSSNEAGLIEFHNHKIYKQEFQIFLSSQDIVILGYNQILKKANQDLNNLDIQKKYDHLLSENKVLNDLVAQAEERIKQLEASQPIEQLEQNNLLDLIFDDTTRDRYAPDLVLSIKLWESIYILNPKDDSHSNKADTWLKNNTGYDTTKKAGPASKIREITAPFINWSTHRDKTYKK